MAEVILSVSVLILAVGGFAGWYRAWEWRNSAVRWEAASLDAEKKLGECTTALQNAIAQNRLTYDPPKAHTPIKAHSSAEIRRIFERQSTEEIDG